MKWLIRGIFKLGFIFIAFAVNAEGTLSDNLRIESRSLDYALQYRIYIPEDNQAEGKLPTIYITDGQWYLSEGKFKRVLDNEISAGRIKPVIAIFVDNLNPDNLYENRRNQEFFCNPDYASFYTDELVPHISATYPVSQNREDRVILGVSFGGYNSACFGLMAPQTFGGIAMNSPANTKLVNKMRKFYIEQPRLPIKIFLSVGSENDNTIAGRLFRTVLKKKGYNLTYMEVRRGHSWNNWRPLIDDVLRTFFQNN